MSEPVKLERLHYREFVRNGNAIRRICHECKMSWPCQWALGRRNVDPWWYINPQQPKDRHDAEA